MDGAQRLFRGVYVSASVEVDLLVRARAALLVHPTGVVGGVAAAAVWGSTFGSTDAEVDLYVTVAGARSQLGLRTLRGALRSDEITAVDAVRVTTPARTALDLARSLPLVEAVAAVEALCRATSLRFDDVRIAARDRPLRGVRTVDRVLELCATGAGSPMWSRARLVLVLRGVAVPEVSYRLRDGERLELAWPEVRYGLGATRGGPPAPALAHGGWCTERIDPCVAVAAPDRFAADVVRGLSAARRRAL